MIKNTIYKCIYVSGGGKEYDGGDWEVITDTSKTLVLKKVREEFFIGIEEKILRLKKDNRCKHCLIIWGNETFTVYPYRSGTPFYFEPITNNIY